MRVGAESWSLRREAERMYSKMDTHRNSFKQKLLKHCLKRLKHAALFTVSNAAPSASAGRGRCEWYHSRGCHTYTYFTLVFINRFKQGSAKEMKIMLVPTKVGLHTCL